MSSELPNNNQSTGILNKLVNKLPILQPLKKRNFRLLWMGEGVSLLGDHIHFIALSWLTLQLTGSGLALGTVLMVGAIPRALLMLFGGALSDRISPRRIMIVSNISRGALVTIMALIVFLNIVELWHLYTLSIAFGIADAFFHPAFNAIVPRVVDKDKLDAGNAILRGTHELSFLIGAAPAGLLISAVGMHIAFGIDALSFAIATIALLMMAEPKIHGELSADELHVSKKPLGLKSIFSDVREGFQYTWKKPAFRAMILAIAVLDFCFAGPFDIGIAWLADNRFTGGASAFGIILSAFGGGALIGTIIAGSYRFRRRGIILALIGVLAGIGLGLFGIMPNTLSAVILSIPMGIILGIFNIMLISWLQQETPSRMIGRVMGLVTFASVGLMPVSFALSGLLVDIHATAMFISAGAITVLTCLYLLSIRAVRRIS